MENDVVRNKLARIEEYIAKLEEIKPASFDAFEKDWKAQMIAERGLQILIEIMIDAANRMIAINGWGPTGSSAESIALLALKKVISSEEPYCKMVKFRNFIVHDYDRIDLAIVYGILTRNLDDIRRFRDELLEKGVRYEQKDSAAKAD